MNDITSRRGFLKQSAATSAGIMGFGGLAGAHALFAAEENSVYSEPRRIIIERTAKIFTSDGEKQYNAFTNIEFWRGKYYVIFTQKSRHHPSPPDGRLIVLSSTDLEDWSATTLPDAPGDDRDAKLLATPDRLIAYNTPWPNETMVSYTEDGVHWSEPVTAYPGGSGGKGGGSFGAQFWKPKFHDGQYYAACDYTTDKVELVKSSDGLRWEHAATILSGDKHPHTGRPTETAIVFLEDGRCLALIRLNGVNSSTHPNNTIAGFGIAEPPFTSWDFTLGHAIRFSGQAVERFGDTIVVAARAELGKDPGYWDLPLEPYTWRERTALYTFNLDTMRLELHALLPAEHGLDTSYCGLLKTGDDTALLSWYNGNVKTKSDVYLSHLRIVA